jgi:pimeloyl-ACP methyl ester carboxylesterase
LEQYFRQGGAATGPRNRDISVEAGVALFAKIGPSVLIAHSAGCRTAWLVAMKAPNVKAAICMETGGYPFPPGEIPPPTSPPEEILPATEAEFAKLTQMPILVIFGDNIPTKPSSYSLLDAYRISLIQADRFVNALKRHGGDAQLLHLPEIGIYGNTHYIFRDKNNVQVADLVSKWLKKKRLDKYPTGRKDNQQDW